MGPRVGPEPNDAKDCRVLSMFVQCGAEGLEHETDRRQARSGPKAGRTFCLRARPGCKPVNCDSKSPFHCRKAHSRSRAPGKVADGLQILEARTNLFICRSMSKPTAQSRRAEMFEQEATACEFVFHAEGLQFQCFHRDGVGWLPAGQ